MLASLVMLSFVEMAVSASSRSIRRLRRHAMSIGSYTHRMRFVLYTLYVTDGQGPRCCRRYVDRELREDDVGHAGWWEEMDGVHG